MTPQSSILSRVPFLRFTATFGIGIVTGYYVEINFFILACIFALLGVAILLSKAILKSRPLYSSILFPIFISLLFVLIGIAYSSYYRNARFKTEISDGLKFSGIIQEKSTTKNDRFKYIVKLNSKTDSITTQSISESIVLYNSDSLSNQQLQIGSKILFSSKLYPLPESNNPGEFSYKKYLERQGIRYQAYLRKAPEILQGKKFSLKTYALTLRSLLLDKFQKHNIVNDEFAVLAALTLGDKNYLSFDLKTSFATSGAMHVLAVSGLHVGILYLIISWLLKPLSKRRRLKSLNLIVILLFLWGYAFITGLSPSVLRACTMFSLIAIGNNMKRLTNIYNTIAVSAFILMLVNPLIITEVGFQLSYTAVLSIVYFQPRIVSVFQSKYKIINWLWGLLAVSIAAQIGTFPLSVYYFHQFPVYFWVSNFIVIPSASILMYGSLLFFISLPIPFLPIALSVILKYVTKGMIFLITKCEALPGSLVENIWINEISVVLFYAFILSVAVFINKKTAKSMIAGLSLLITITLYSLFININIYTQKRIIFYNNYSETLISFIDGTEHFYYSNSDSISINSQRLLENSTGKFHTKMALPISTTSKTRNNIAIHRNFIFFRNVSVFLHENSLNENNVEELTYDIAYNLTNSEITTIKISEFTPEILKKGKLNKWENKKSELKFKTLNNSALILNLRSN